MTAPAPLRHPGPAAAERIAAVPARTRAVAVDLPAGAGLAAALQDAVHRLGVTAAQVELVGGTLGEVSYCIPAYCTDGSRAAHYSATRTSAGPVAVVAGAAGTGTRDGAPFTHAHLAWIDRSGALLGGHLWPATTVGATGVQALVFPLAGVRNESAEDPETLLPVFTPRPAAGTADGARAVTARVRPGEDLLVAATRICADAGFRRALLRGTLGSLVGPVFPGAARVPAGPCTEVISVRGVVGPDAGAGELHALAVDSDGVVHGGVIDPAASPVAVTVELLLVEADR